MGRNAAMLDFDQCGSCGHYRRNHLLPCLVFALIRHMAIRARKDDLRSITPEIMSAFGQRSIGSLRECSSTRRSGLDLESPSSEADVTYSEFSNSFPSILEDL